MAQSDMASNLSWTVDRLVQMCKKGNVDFEVPIQRGYVWNNKRSSLLVHSILIGLPISDFYFNKVGKTFEGLEGKQRTKAICDYVNGLYKLHKSTPPVLLENGTEISVANRAFNSLDEDLQSKIKSYALRIYVFDNMTDDDKILVFSRINSGLPVSAADIARVKVPSRRDFVPFREHQAIAATVRPSALKKYGDEDIVYDIYILTHIENPSLLTAFRTTVLASVVVTDEQKEELTKALDYMLAFYQTVKPDKKLFSKLRAKTHITMLGYMATLAIRNNISEATFIEKAKAFFNGEGSKVTVSEAYNIAASSGSARADSVRVRMNEVEAALGL